MEDASKTVTNPFAEDSSSKVIQCDTDNILECHSLQRIQLALQQKDEDAQHSNTTQLLNDLFHLKYEHSLHTNAARFDTAFTYLTQDNKAPCDLTQCPFTSHSSPVLSRIHYYLIHSYDIARLSPPDLALIDSKLNEYKESQKNESEFKLDDDEEDEEDNKEDMYDALDAMRLQITSDLMKQKRKHAASIQCSKHKYSEPYHALNYDTYDEEQMQSLFAAGHDATKSKAHNGLTQEQNDKLDQFTNITAADTETAKAFLEAIQWDISTAVDRFFLYNADVSRLPAVSNAAVASENKEEHKEDSASNVDHEIYNLGIRFVFEEDDETRAHNTFYIKPKYDHLRDELMEHGDIKCDAKEWRRVHDECVCLMRTQHIRRMQVAQDEEVSIEHMCAIKVYTSYRAWCNVLCDAFRVNCEEEESVYDLKGKIEGVAVWSKLLSECVQCYGNKTHDSSLYRIMDMQHKLTKLIGRIHVPFSTSTNLYFCQQLVATQAQAMIMELAPYRSADHDEIYAFDCSAISSFDIEEEMFFFNATNGAGDMLQIKSLYHHMSHGWTHYKHYLQALHNLIRFIGGLKLDTANTSMRSQRLLCNMLQHILRTSNYQMDTLPTYMEQILNHLIANMSDRIQFDYADLVENKTLPILKKKNQNVLNIANICNLFVKCKTVCILMRHDLILNDAFCISLISDLQNIGNDMTLIFKWEQPMSLNNHSTFDLYRSELSSMNWEVHFNQKCIKLSSISQLFNEREIAQQQDLWKKFAQRDKKYKKRLHRFSGASEEEKIALLVHGYIRQYLCLPLDIMNFLIVMYGDYHTMYWKVHGVQFWNLINPVSAGDAPTLLSSPIYTIDIMNYCCKFQLQLKQEDDGALILSLNSIADGDTKQAITVSYTMICEETQCEYRHMCVVGDDEGSGWFDDFLNISEIVALNRAQGIVEMKFICNIEVLHIWSQTDPYAEEEVEMMRIYHCGSAMQSSFEYKWILNDDLTASNVTPQYTMWYSPRFDAKNWTAVFVERQDDFLVALKLLSLPFGIGVLLVRCEISVRVDDAENTRHLKDTMLESFKYGEDDAKNMAESKEWAKEDLFGVNWMDDFSVPSLIIDIKVEIVHLEGINEEQIFAINWPLYGITQKHTAEHFNKHNFVLTKEQFETETFGFNYMIGVLRNQINTLQTEIDGLKNYHNKKEILRRVYDDDDEEEEEESEEVQQWLSTIVELPNYYSLFIRNGFNSLPMIAQINDKTDLQYIGITIKAHQIKIINKIRDLQKGNDCAS